MTRKSGKIATKISKSVAVALLTAVMAGTAATAWATEVIWTTKDDFEWNASTTGRPTSRVNIDTTTNIDSIQIGVIKDFVTTATITCVTPDRIYTTGADRASIAVIDTATKLLKTTIALPGPAAGVLYNPLNNRVYVGRLDANQITVIDNSADPPAVIGTLTSGGTPGNGAFAAAYNSNDKKFYVANPGDQTVSIFNAEYDNLAPKTVPVVAGATTASFDAVTRKVYFTSKANQFVTVVDGQLDTVADVQVAEVLNLLGGQEPGKVGLQVDAPALGITSAGKMKLSWDYQCQGANQKIQLQVRTAEDLQALDAASYTGPEGATNAWYESICTEAGAPQTATVDLGIDYRPAAEIQVKLSSDGLGTPRVDAVKLVYESFPDLVVTSVSGSSSAVVGSPIDIASSVKNQGSATAEPFVVQFYLHNTKTDVDYLIGERNVPSLQAGDTDTATTAIPVPLTAPPIPTGDDYVIKACADPANQVAELLDDNNCSVGGPVSLRSGPADLVVKSVSGTVSQGKLTYTVTIKNQGNTPVPATPNFTTEIYLSTDSVIDSSDSLMTYLLTYKIKTAGLAAGAETTVTNTVFLPIAPMIQTNYYYVGAIADSTNVVVEYDDNSGNLNNKVASANPQYVFNDLRASEFSASISGTEILYSLNIINDGNGTAGWFKGYLYLDNGTTIYKAGPAMQTISSLAGGSSVVRDSSQVRMFIPAGVTPGYYKICGRADEEIDDNPATAPPRIVDPNPANNTKCTDPIPVYLP